MKEYFISVCFFFVLLIFFFFFGGVFGVFLPCSFRLLCSFNNLEKLLVNSTNSLSGVEAFETLKAGRVREHEHPAACLYPAFTP